MPILNSAVQLATKPFPRAISPKTHAIIDYATVASLFVMAGLFWKRNKRAAIAALIVGGIGRSQRGLCFVEQDLSSAGAAAVVEAETRHHWPDPCDFRADSCGYHSGVIRR